MSEYQEVCPRLEDTQKLSPHGERGQRPVPIPPKEFQGIRNIGEPGVSSVGLLTTEAPENVLAD